MENVGDFTEWANNYTHYSTETMYIGNDINLAGFTSIPSFSGTLEGNSYVLSGLTAPLFTELSATINNVTIADSLITTDYAGALAKTIGGGALTNVNVKNCFIKGTTYAGGLVGRITDSTTTITDCSATSCTIVGTSVSAGISPSVADISHVTVSHCDILSPSGTAYGVSP